MSQRTYEVTLTGQSPLLMHRDDIEWADRLKKWREDPANQKERVAGDDRSPGFSWLGCLYHDNRVVTLPSDNLMRCLLEGGAMVPVPKGRSGKTFKAQTQSGMLPEQEHWPLMLSGKPVPIAPLFALRGETDFEKHDVAAREAGFTLYVKRAKVGQSKHVRVRPRFDGWSARGTIQVWDDQITTGILADILRLSGAYRGLGDWRPSSPKAPGPFGRFTANVKEL